MVCAYINLAVGRIQLSTPRFHYTHAAAAAAAAKSLQSCPTLVRTHRQQPTRLPCLWDSPGKNTGVGCHFLLQCMKVKSESEVTQLCPTLSDPMDCSLPGSSIRGIFQARVLEWGAIAVSDRYSQTHTKVASLSSVGKEFACNEGHPDSIPGSGRSSGEGNGNPIQYSCLENQTEEPDSL